MEAALDAAVPPDWPGAAPVETWLRRSMSTAMRRWSSRAVILRASGEMAGHAGFHLPPGHDVIAPWAPGGVEIGYTIFEAHRRRGLATEATSALVEFARSEGVPSVLATTQVDNVASRGVLLKCGFQCIDQVREDEVVEDVWLLRLGSPGSASDG